MTNTEYLQRYNLLPDGIHVLCALSGGRDSVYLLYRLLEWASERNLRVSAAHYNHCLRGEESQRDEDFVRALCEKVHVPLLVERGDVRCYAAENGLGVEEAARTLRYAFLERCRQTLGADVIATAHHADDLAETMLFQLARGAGTKGLSGIPPKREHIIRPILMITREEINSYLLTQGIEYVDDSSNELDDRSRNMIRHQVIPVLQKINSGFVHHAAQSAMLLREDEEYLCMQAERFLKEHPVQQGIEGDALRNLGFPVASRVIRAVWGGGLSRNHVRQIYELCTHNGLAYVHVPNAVVRYDAGRLWTDEELCMPDEMVLLGERGTINFGAYQIQWKIGTYNADVHNSLNTFCLKYENMKGTVIVSGKRDGDRVKFAGTEHTKKLKQLFQEKKLTQVQRAQLPVFRDEQGIVAVYGFGIAQRCVPEIGDKIVFIKCDK